MKLDEAIRHAEEVAEEQVKRCEKCAEEHRQLTEWLKELKQLREQTRWIPVSERLPKERKPVLVYCLERKNIYCAYYEEKQWWIYGAYFTKIEEDVIAWQPLPEAYKEVR